MAPISAPTIPKKRTNKTAETVEQHNSSIYCKEESQDHIKDFAY